MTYPKTGQTRPGTTKIRGGNPKAKGNSGSTPSITGSGESTHYPVTKVPGPGKTAGQGSEVRGRNTRGYSDVSYGSPSVKDVTTAADGTKRVRKIDG